MTGPILAAVAALAATPVQAWPDTGAGRRGAAAELRRFEAALDHSESATAVLRAWCAEHRMADPPVIRALRDAGPETPATPETRRRLQAAPDERLRYRRVKLVCGDHVLSEADNWYRPSVLTPEMNARLAGSDTPFGVAVKTLNFHRRTLGVDWLLKLDRRGAAGGELSLPHAVLRHRAVLETAQAVPFSLVVETYTAEVLSGPPAAASEPVSR